MADDITKDYEIIREMSKKYSNILWTENFDKQSKIIRLMLVNIKTGLAQVEENFKNLQDCKYY